MAVLTGKGAITDTVKHIYNLKGNFNQNLFDFLVGLDVCNGGSKY